MEGKNAESLWLDYQFMTKEMIKFLPKQDMELFYELLNQRAELQTIIEQTPDDDFKLSPAGRSLLSEIQQDSQTIILDLQLQLGRSKRQHQVSEAYGAASTTAVSQMHQKR